MGNYIEINNYSGLGKMGISRSVLESIASKAVGTIKGASLSTKESIFLFQIVKPVRAVISKNGIANIKVSVNIAEGNLVKDVCTKIQEEITSAVKMMCETIPVSVSVSVESVG